ncbi:hypothetical protein C797_21698, partial [Bacillus thuringiensis Sbt003]
MRTRGAAMPAIMACFSPKRLVAIGGGTSDEGLSEGVQDSEYRKRQADHRRAPAKAVLAENDPERCRHLSYELHDKEDSHKCGDDSHAPRPPEGADWVEGSQGHRSRSRCLMSELTYINCVALTARFPVGKPVVPAALMNRPTRGER